MPKGPSGQKRPADVIGNAVHVMRIAAGQIEERLLRPKPATPSQQDRRESPDVRESVPGPKRRRPRSG